MERRNEAVTVIPHQLIIQDRKQMELTGVSNVESFDENTVTCYTSFGKLSICGQDLHLHRLDLDGTILSIEGKIETLSYIDVKKGGRLGRLFR